MSGGPVGGVIARAARAAALGLALLCAAAPAAAQKRIALTFDDAPRSRGPFLSPDARTRGLIAGLREGGVAQAAFFVVPCRIGQGDDVGGEERIMAYAAAGHAIANHSCTHPHLGDTTAAAFLADIDRAAAWLDGRRGYRPWFRFPYLDEGGRNKAKRDAVRAGLAARGLANGYVTAESSDWNFEQLTTDAGNAGKRIDRVALRDLYVESHVEAADFADALMTRTLGRQPVQVMLLHELDLAALYIGDLVKALRAAGWTIVTADEAYADPLREAVRSVDVPAAQGTLSEALAWQKGLPAPRWYARNTPSIADPLFAARVLHESTDR